MPPALNRKSGILLHISSLPGGHGIGDLGPASFEFIDFLNASGQSFWQILPLAPTGKYHSPYQSYSAFASNPLFINLDKLISAGYLESSDIKEAPLNSENAQFDEVKKFKEDLFLKAFSKWFENNGFEKKSFRQFQKLNAFWLQDYSLFLVIKKNENKAQWDQWPDLLRKRDSSALEEISKNYFKESLYHQFTQFLFFQQWNELKCYAEQKNIRMIGDLPIFVDFDSSDVWAYQHLFWLGNDKKPIRVAGCPPDYFSPTGQRWGNPLYLWDVLKEKKYFWWVERIKQALTFVDILRLDHFIGFYRYWSIPLENKTAEFGEWLLGPSEDFFQVLKKELKRLPFIAEDLGAVTEEVVLLRDKFKFPGMKVLQFGFLDPERKNPHQINRITENNVIYTGTHDNNTSQGWLKEGLRMDGYDEERSTALKQLNCQPGDFHWSLIEMAQASPAKWSIIPAQDLLGLGETARMNVPGSASGNWSWRLTAMQMKELKTHLAQKLLKLTICHSRNSPSARYLAAE
ncbi:MAG: 4-alpha-glucanotransferase [Elusimicrobiota bacterium]